MRENSLLIISSSPHIRDKDSIPKIMWTVVISLLSPLLAGIYFFGLKVLIIVLVSTTTAIATEAIIQKLTHRKITILDGSAAVTGILLAMVIPPGVPIWLPIVGAFCSIAIAKAPFGGLGNNIFNPALIGRAILLASFPVYMTSWTPPAREFNFYISGANIVDSITSATTLGIIKEGNIEKISSIWNLFIGREAGSIGETSVLALLLGASILLLKKYITWHIPISFIGTVAILNFFVQLFGDHNFNMILVQIFSGGLFLGAFFMATDMVTSPLTKKGGLIFGSGAGILTFVIRTFGGFPEGVCYAILIMNAFTPIIDRYVRPRRLGFPGWIKRARNNL